MRVLTWNLFHGRSRPPAGRSLQSEFTELLATWSWDVALLQEVPPWWPPALAAASGATQRTALTSRNSLLPVRRFIADRWPDLIKSNGGGANAILVRGGILEHRVRRLRVWPERRVVHAVGLEDGRWAANVHATVHDDRKAREEARAAAETVLRWAGDAPVALGGDFNVRRLELAGLEHAGGRGVDHVFARGMAPAGPTEVLDRGTLSDHAPVVVELT